MPGYRGRLIFPQLVVIERLNTVKTRAAGYDDVFREPKNFTNTDGDRENTRTDDLIRLPCQIEDYTFRALRQLHAGDNPNSRYHFVFHFRDLEKQGLIDENGNPLITKNDRIVEVREKCRDKLIRKFEDDKQLYFTEPREGFGIGPNRNLLVMIAEERETGVSATS